MNESTSWAADLAAASAWVLHKQSGVVGQAKHLHDRGAWISPINGERVEAPVLELVGGHAFVAHRGSFHVLAERDADYQRTLVNAIAHVMQNAAGMAEAMRIEPTLALMLARSAFEEVRRQIAKAP
jgi:hypothetical protein